MVFALKNIYKDYLQGKEAVPVLKDISLDVSEGEYVAIMGPSGSGKSTLMNIIGCLDKQTKGSFVFDGCDIMQAKDRKLSEIRKCGASAALCGGRQKRKTSESKGGS